MKTKYDTPGINVLMFGCDDVITASGTVSGGLTDLGTYDANNSNGGTGDWEDLFG